MQIFVVGGFVRDTLLGRKAKDMDFVVVGATPQEMIDLGFSQVGADFPVFLDRFGNEWALARKERKVGVGYHGFECEFDPTVTLEDDLFRRDLTINAMAMPVLNVSEGGEVTIDHDTIIDPFGGKADLQSEILRHVSDHFAEDPVRVLRLARFSARYGFTVDEGTLELIEIMCRNGELDHLVPERVWAELEKAIMEPLPHRFFHVLEATSACEIVFPELKNVARLWNIGLGVDARERFALLALQMGPGGHGMFRRLKAPNDLHNFIFKLGLMVHLMSQHQDSGHELAAEDIMWLLKTNDCYRDKQFMLHAMWTLKHYDEHMFNWSKRLFQAQIVTADIGFANLTQAQQETLKGAQIGEAIDELRLEAVYNL